jgi:putative DNA primase/helicase
MNYQTNNISHPSEFLKFLWGNNFHPGYINILGILKIESNGQKNELIESKFISTNQINDVDSAVQEYNNTLNVYFGLGTRRNILPGKRRGTAGEVSALPGFWMDFDSSDGNHNEKNIPNRGELQTFMFSLPWKPSLILNSGGGFHVYWLFDQSYIITSETDRMRISALSINFQESIFAKGTQYGWKFDKTANISGALRLPGTTNKKYNPVRTVFVEYSDPSCRYPYQSLSMSYNKPVQGINVLNNNNSLDSVIDGSRNTQLTSIAGSLRYNGMDEEQLNINLQQINQNQCYPPLPEKEVAGIARSVAKYTPGVYHQTNISQQNITQQNINYELSDIGNATLFVDYFLSCIRYCHAFQKWLIYDGTRWKVDTNQTIDTLAKQLITEIYSQNNTITDLKQQKLQKHYLQSQSYKSLISMLKIAKTDERIKISANELDVDLMLLNCLNGTIDLRTGNLLDHDKINFITKTTNIIYDVNATCPVFMKFMNEIMLENLTLINYLRRFVGYSLTGLINEECLIILIGEGCNGKTKFREVIRSLLGEYAGQCDFNTLNAINNDNRIRNDLAKLIGSRCAMVAETEKKVELAWSLIKSLTGGDWVQARHLYKDYIEFKPTFKFYLATNHMPVIDVKDKGAVRRVHVINFKAYFPENIIDRYLENKLKDELPGILNWAIQGCLEWQEMKSLNPPAEVLLNENISYNYIDKLAEFFDDCLELSDSGRIRKTTLLKLYKQWCQENNIQIIPKKQFYKIFTDKQFYITLKDGIEYFTGIQEKQIIVPEKDVNIFDII